MNHPHHSHDAHRSGRSHAALTRAIVIFRDAFSDNTLSVTVVFLIGALISIYMGIIFYPATASAAAPCEALSGDTQPVMDANGYMNSGAMYFGKYGPGRPTESLWWSGLKIKKPVYYAPDEQVACASKVNEKIYLQGWVWNDNIGWISLYCPGDGNTNRGVACGVVKYGVQIDPKNGVFSGYAWSNGGWIRMGCLPSVGYGEENYCAKSKHQVTFDVKTGVVPTPAFEWADPVLNNSNYTSWAWSSALQWLSFGGLKVPLDKLVNETCDLKKNPKGCLNNDIKLINSKDSDPDAPAPPADKKGITLETADGEFPVTVADPLYLDGALKASSAVNPVSQASVRNLIYRNVVKYRKNASTACGNNGDFLLSYKTNDRVFYCKGDIHLKAGAKWTGSKTLIIDGGNLFIEGSLFSDKGQMGLIILRDKLSNKKQGNVYITPSVRDMRIQLYADGSIYPAVTDANGEVETDNNGVPTIDNSDYAIKDKDSLFGQLYIQGMMISDNSQALEGDTKNENKGAAQLRSLGYLRSMPAKEVSEDEGNPNGKKTKQSVKWEDYFVKVKEAKENGGKIDVEENDGDTNSNSQNNTDNKDSTKKEKKKLTIKLNSTNLDPVKEKSERKSTHATSKIVQGTSTAAIKQAEALLSDSAVYIKWEPTAPDLPGFEAILGGSYRQTGG